ncbi:MAG: T9SS type A sorting domain-containing protein [Bacteroidetes bacterium]|nr:T9SS type A sorting domain-containing protein [Bacteroidota bacterium]
MKKFLLLFAMLLASAWSLLSQTCLPEGIEFTHQTQIDSFSINYPGCNTIIGNLTIKGDDIVNLDGLGQLRYVMGLLRVTENKIIENLDGLSEIKYPGQVFFISKNPELKQLLTLTSPELEIGGLSISDNPKLHSLLGLESIVGLHNLDIVNNDMLYSLQGLNSIEIVKSQVRIQKNQGLIDLTGLDNLSELESDLLISLNDNLSSFYGLQKLATINGSLHIVGNQKLHSFSGLDSLKTINKILVIDDNETLTDISALEQLNPEKMDSIQITDNKLLKTCHIKSVCNYIGLSHNGIYLHDNAEGCMDKAQIESGCQGSGIENHIDDHAFKVFPNPASNYVTLELKDNLEISSIEVYDISGNMVHFQTEDTNSLNVSALSTGMYVVKVSAKSIISRQKLFIKH